MITVLPSAADEVPAIGTKFSSGIFTYEITSAGVDGTDTVAITGFFKGKSTVKLSADKSIPSSARMLSMDAAR